MHQAVLIYNSLMNPIFTDFTNPIFTYWAQNQKLQKWNR